MIPILLLLAALCALFLEFCLPGGILGLISFVLFLVSIVSAYQTFEGIGFIFFLFISSCLLVFVIRYSLRVLRSTNNTLCLHDTQEGYEGSECMPEYIGKEGIALCDLRPAGFVHIEGNRLQVVCQQKYVDKGERVVVVASRGGYLVVSPKE